MKRFHGFELRWLCLALAIMVAGVLPFAAEGGPQQPSHFSWSTTMAGADKLAGVTWDGAQFVAVGDKGAVYTSQDGSSWTLVPPKTAQLLTGATSGDEKLVIVGPKGLLLSTRDGKEWSRGTIKPASDLSAVTYAQFSKKDGLFVAVGSEGAIVTSKKGQEWKETSPNTTSDLNAVAWGGPKNHELFVAVGKGGSIVTSQDGRQWAESKPVPQDLYGVAWGGERFVAVGQNGIILVSDEGLEWTPAVSGTTFTLNAAAWCGSRFVAVGASGTILTSANGLNWYPEPSVTATWLNGVAFSGNTIVAVGESGMVLFAPGTSITGKVVRTGTGVGVAGLTVTITGGYPSTTTASDGTYSFTGLASGTYTVDVPNTTAYWLYPHNRIVDISGGDAVNINFTAYAYYVVKGTVSFPAGTPTPYPSTTIWFYPVALPSPIITMTMDTTTGQYNADGTARLAEGAWTVIPWRGTNPPPSVYASPYYVFNPQERAIDLIADATYDWTALASVRILGGIVNSSPCTLDLIDIMATAQDGTGTYTTSRIGAGFFPDPGPPVVPPLIVPQNKTYNVTYSTARGLTPNYSFNPSPQVVNVGTTDVPAVATLATPSYAVIAHCEYQAPGPVWTALAGATVSLKQFPGGTVMGTCITGADGNCTIESAIHGVTYTLEATKSGYFFLNSTAWPPWTESLCVDNDQTNNPACLLQAKPAYDVSGRVTYAGTNSGIGGATVSIGGVVPDVTTDSNGYYILHDVPTSGSPPVTYHVAVTKAGYTFSPDPASILVVDQNLTNIDFTGVGNYHVTGTVHYITPTTCGTEIPAVTITAAVPGIGSFTYLTTGAAGEIYSIVVPPANGIVITATRTGYTFLPIQYTVNVTTADQGGNNFTAYCPNTYTIMGGVWAAGSPLAGVNVSAGPGLTAGTNAAGYYYFNGTGGLTGPKLPAGSYTLVPSLPGYVFTPQSRTVTLPCTGTVNCSSGNATDISFIATKTYSILGSVTATGAGATVTATMAGQSPVSATAAADGSYTIAGLIPGTWRVTPTKTGFTFLGSSGNPYNDVPITNSDVGSINFSCTPIPTFTIAGNVFDLSNNPVIGATLTASSGQTTTSVAGGAYTLTGFTNGTYTISCTFPGLTFLPNTVTISGANQIGIDFHATTGFAVTGRVTQGNPAVGFPGVSVQASQGGVVISSGTTNGSGDYTIPGLANGTYTVTPVLAGYGFSPGSQTAVVFNANTTNVNFQRTYSISGSVTLSGGTPLAGVTVSTNTGLTGTTLMGGTYIISGVLPGIYTLTPSLAGYAFTPETMVVTVASADLTDKNFTASPYYTIGGRVLLSGSGFSGVTITITHGGSVVDVQYTGAAGYYTSDLLPPGSYLVTPTMTGYEFSPASSAIELTTFNQTTVNFVAGEVAAPPKPTSVSPSSGSTLGGTAVTITGTGFLSGATVTFDASAASSVVVVSTTSITCTTPAHAAGAVNVTVKNNDDQSGVLAGGYTYTAPPTPTVTNINPASGPEAGNTSVTITGTNFTGATGVKFGTTSANFTVNSATQITAISPAGKGIVDVTVTTPGGTSAVVTVGKFTYIAPGQISIQSITPGSGPVTGGTTVTILGTMFATGATVLFDTSAATSVVVSGGTQITCVTPAHAAGLVSLTVKNPDNQSATIANAFRYGNPAPTIASISPSKGSAAGQTNVTIFGTNFLAGATVTFGTTSANNVNVVNPATITCTTPAHNAGAVNVVVTNSDAQVATLTGGFTFVSPPVVTAIKKYTDPFRLKLNGTNFHTNCTIKINGVPVPVTDYKQSTKLFAKGGASLKAMVPKGVTVQVTVVNNDDGISSLGLPYTR